MEYDGVNVNHPLAPSLDHITPQWAGGRWTLDNLQLAHEACNCAKSQYDKLLWREAQSVSCTDANDSNDEDQDSGNDANYDR